MSHRKAFCCAFVLTLCGALLCGGLLTADVNTRRITFEDSTPPYAVEASSGYRVPLPVGGEALRLVYRAEKSVLGYLLDKFENIT